MVRRRGTRERLEDIRNAAADALAFASGLDAVAFAALPGADRLLARHPDVDWRGWAGLRDVVSHQYFSLELPRLRPTVMNELPALLAAVRAELGQA
jgi:uncharacterized protein with HEPN domain